ncbi:MAG: PEGA domain-containing protein [Acidobacteria bacterium]|nr:PEGA domain-containing protein [Acidobacteriota bacterium]
MGRTRVATSVLAALALIAAVEAGVIAVLARALWVAPHPAIVVETAASGENVLVSSRSTEAAPLRLTVAPDLRWVQLASPSSAGVLGGKVTDTAAGTIRISSPIELKVFEQSRLLGSVPGAGLKVPAGRHDIELVNLALGYRLWQTLDVEAGQTVSIHVAPPPGWVTIDAAPWAEVSIDGQAVGRTPLGPLPLTPGEHDVTFRSPAGVTDRQRVTVRSEATIRVIGKLDR